MTNETSEKLDALRDAVSHALTCAMEAQAAVDAEREESKATIGRKSVEDATPEELSAFRKTLALNGDVYKMARSLAASKRKLDRLRAGA